MSDTKTCPQCAEDIKAKARACRFCGHAFPEELPPPAALVIDTAEAATVIFTGRCHRGELESTNLRVYLFGKQDGKLAEVAPIAVAGNGRWRPATEHFVAQSSAASGRAGVRATHAVYTTNSRAAGVDEPFQIEFLVPIAVQEIGWAPMLCSDAGGEVLDGTGYGSCPVRLAAGQTVVVSLGPILACRGLDSMGHPHLGFAGAPGTSRVAPVVQITTADAEAQAGRWSGVEEIPPPSGRTVDPLLLIMGEAARQRRGHGASLIQADAGASGAAMGAKLGAAYAENKRKKTLLDKARKAVVHEVAAATPGACDLLDEHLTKRDGDALDGLAEKVAAGVAVQVEWDALTATVTTAKATASKAASALGAFASRIGTAAERAGDADASLEGMPALLVVVAQIDKLQGEHDALAGASGFFAKAKAAAQQVALKAQIALAEHKRNGLRTSIGTAILAAGTEGAVPDQDALQAEIAEARVLLTGATEQRALAVAARDEARAGFAERLGVETLPEAGPASLLTALRAQQGAAQGGQASWLDHTTDALLAAGPEHWPAAGPLRAALDDLAMKQEIL